MEVQIIRREEISHLPTKVMNESKITIGSHFEPNGRGPLRGLSREEEDKYLPRILGADPKEPTYRQKVQEFWATMSIPVPVGGAVLDITVDEQGEPYNLEDWIRYKWAQKHRYVASNKLEMDKDPRKKFYIRDPEEDTRRKNASIQVQKQADIEFIKASQDPEKGRRIIRIMNNVINPDVLSDSQVENELFELKNNEPARFLTVAKDKKLDTKAEIQSLVTAQILRKVGQQIIYIDQVIGDTMDDAVAWYTNPKNSTIVTDLKAKLKELN